MSLADPKGIVAKGKRFFQRCPNCGTKTVKEIQEWLKLQGYEWTDEGERRCRLMSGIWWRRAGRC